MDYRVKTAQPSPPWYPCVSACPPPPTACLAASCVVESVGVRGEAPAEWSALVSTATVSSLSAGLRQVADTRYTQLSKYIILEILVWDRNFCFMQECMMMMIYFAQVKSGLISTDTVNFCLLMVAMYLCVSACCGSADARQYKDRIPRRL